MRIRVHYSWYLGFAILTALVVTQFSDAYQIWQRVVYSIIGGMIPFVAVTVKQVILNALAISLGIPIRNVTLFILGGLSGVPQKDTKPGFELLLAVSGLVLNFVIGGVLYWAYLHLAYPDNPMVTELARWLIFIWFVIVVLHFVPVYPLDCGRLVAAIMWQASRRYSRSLRIMTRWGWFIGWLITAGGVWLMFRSEQWITGLLPTYLGWVLQSAATQSIRRVAILQALQPIHANQVMNVVFPVISSDANLHQIVRRHALTTGHHFFLVAEEGKFLGILRLRRIKKIPRRRWRSTLVREVMTPARKVRTADSNESAARILERMEQFGIEEMPVLAETQLLGTVTRSNLALLAKTRVELTI